MELSAHIWNQRYHDNNTGWDIGYPATPLKEYFDQLSDKSLHILIPGGGNAYEAEYLFNNGFKHVFVLDWSQQALNNFAERVPDFPKEQLIQGDFFEHQGAYDRIIEQTFFCAIDTSLRSSYATHAHRLLKDNGKLVGLLWNAPMNSDRPPYGGSKEEYFNLFSPLFTIDVMDASYNSIGPRKGRELFINLKKRP